VGKIELIETSSRESHLIEAVCGQPPTGNGIRKTIGVLPGEGVGPEVIDVALRLLEIVANNTEYRFDIRTGGKIGIPAKMESGHVLTDEVTGFCNSIFSAGGALLCGPGGGRFVYELRSAFDLFCKLTPLRPVPVLGDSGVVRQEARADVDVMLVRENTGGLYFGDWGQSISETNVLTAYQAVEYQEDKVLRILEVALRLADARSKKLCLAVKPDGIPAISELWVTALQRLSRATDIESVILEVDNAAFQLIASARDYDVVVSPNMFGDILADTGALLLGSRGLSYSANFNPSGAAVYQTGHGAAHDIAGSDTANPIGQIMSLAMMLRESFGLCAAAEAIETSIEEALAARRTADIQAPGKKTVGTSEMGRCIAGILQTKLTDSAVPA